MSKYFDGKHLFAEPRVEQYGNNMVMTNVMKPLKKKIICLDTKMCDDFQYYIPSTNSQATCSTTNSTIISIPERINEVKNIRVKNVELPITMTNISSSIGNHSFKITNNTTGASATIVLTNGNYSSSTLATEINNKLASAGFSTLSLSTTTGYTVFTSTATNTTYTIDFTINKDGVFDKYNFRNKLGWFLGFRSHTYRLVSVLSAVSVSSEALINLDGLSYVYLVVDEYTNDKSADFVAFGTTNIPNILAKISIDKVAYPFGTYLVANDSNGLLISNKRTYTNKVDIQKLAIRLVDDRGINVNLNGRDFSFSLEIDHE